MVGPPAANSVPALGRGSGIRPAGADACPPAPSVGNRVGQDDIAGSLRLPATWLRPDGQEAEQEAEQKAEVVRELRAAGVAAIGNGANDVGMLQAAELAIAVLGPEGLAREAADAADVLVPSVHDALDLLLRPKRLVATLRR